MIAGVNYPWLHYGCDFGRNKWGSHIGVSTHAADVAADFAAMAAAGIEVARWFVFTDGRGGLSWSALGELTGVDEAFNDDMDAALDLAAEHGVRLCPVLLDFAWLDDPGRRLALLDRHGASAFLDRVVEPFLDRYGARDEIQFIDIINEPEWATLELATDRQRAAWPLERLRAFIGAAADRTRARSRALVTVGGGRISAAREWDDPAYGLDVVQVHSYPDVRYPHREESLFGRRAADFRLVKPLLIGECPSHPRVRPDGHLSPAFSLRDYLDLAREGGYLGAWPWSFKGADAFGAVNLEEMAAWRQATAAGSDATHTR